MRLYGIGLEPDATDLLTMRGRRRVNSVDILYSSRRLARHVTAEYVSRSKLSDHDLPMPTGPKELQAA